MRTVSLRFADMTDKTRIPIGLVGENLATRVIIDCKKIYEQYPYAAAALTVKPPFEDAFPAIVSRDGNTIIWDVLNTALTQDGEGEVQLAFTMDNKVVRSATSKIEIKKSLTPTGNVPDPIDDFLVRANAALSLIPETINEALQEAKDSGGFDGFSPTATISQNDREIVIAITDKNGTTTGRFYMISSYTELNNKPSINNVVLEGNKSASEFGITMIPQGGSQGQYLAKASSTDFDIEWKTETGETIDYSNLQNKPQIAGVVLNGSKSLNDFGIASEESVNAKADKTDTLLNGTLSLGRIEGTAVGANSIALGNGVTANANNMHAQGVHNVADTLYPVWEAGHHYSIGDVVTNPDGAGVACITANSDVSYSPGKWAFVDERGSNSAEKTAFVIGNGTNEHNSNAMRVDWDGNQYISGDLYVSSNDTGTSGTKVATVEDVRENTSALELYVDQISAELVTDITRKANKADTVLSSTLSMGRKTGTTVGANSVALGNNVEASGAYSHAEGYQSTARGQMAHSEGNDTTASGSGSHAEGYHTTASAAYSHAEGYGSAADGSSSHAEGINTVASGAYSHAEGYTTIANHLAQHVFGQSNVSDPSLTSTTVRGNYVEIVGNGTANTPSNARTLDWDGNERLAGEVYVNCNSDSTGGVRLAKITDIPDGPDGIPASEKGAANGVAELDQNGKVPAGQLPSYVDDVVEYNSLNDFPETGESGKIYVAKDTNVTYRWSGSTYVVIGTDLALGETSTTAYRGDRGKAAYDAAVVNPDATPTANSTNLVQSGGVYSVLETKYEKPASGIPASDLADGVIPDVPVQDVQVDGTSVVSQGVANMPIADNTSNLGLVKINPSYGIAVSNASNGNVLVMNSATGNEIKAGSGGFKTITPTSQHYSVFYGLAKAAGDATQSASDNPVGTYTSQAKSAIKTMLGVTDPTVTDVQIGGTSILSQGVADIPILTADSNVYGIGKINGYNGLTVIGGVISTNGADSNLIKAGGQLYRPIVPGRQHESTFYGLAKAAGDNTQSASNNAVGTYTDEAKTAIQNMLGVSSASDISGKVDKSAIDNTGITSKTYTEKFGGEFQVTTAVTSGIISPYARASITGSLEKAKKYRVTFDGQEYELTTDLWFYNTITASSASFKIYTYIGNIALFVSDTTGIDKVYSSVPFCIIYDRDGAGAIDVLTTTASAHTILVEEASYVKTDLPTELIYGDSYKPFIKRNNSGTYNGLSIGVNKITNTRGSFAIGYGNTISNEFSTAIGFANEISAIDSFAEGIGNTITGANSHAEGLLNAASGTISHAEGYSTQSIGDMSHSEGTGTTASGGGSHAEGHGTTASGAGGSHAEGYQTTASGTNGAHAEGNATTASGNRSHAEGSGTNSVGIASHAEGNTTYANGASSHAEGSRTIANGNSQHVVGSCNIADSYASWSEWVANTSYTVGDKVKVTATQNNETIVTGYICKTANSDSTFTASNWTKDSRMNYVEIVGNGTADNARSNAYSLDWNGNGRFAGKIYINCNSDSTGGTMLPTDVQVNGTSVVSQGIANVPLATNSANGVLHPQTDRGLSVGTTGILSVNPATSNEIKAETQQYKPIVPNTQHQSVFYGLAKAAGDATQSASSNAVGTYTSEAKTAIKTMLGIASSDITDVQVNGTSIVSNGVANIPVASSNEFGVFKTSGSAGLKIDSNGYGYIGKANDSQIKDGVNNYSPIVPDNQHKAIFYGLSKLAGENLSSDTVTVGTYPEKSISAISQMLNAPVSISGTTPSITAKSGVRYICGEVSTLTITAPESGCIDVTFTSGSTPTVLTVATAKTGATLKWANGFDPTSLEANTTYEVNILDGEFGVVGSWT